MTCIYISTVEYIDSITITKHHTTFHHMTTHTTHTHHTTTHISHTIMAQLTESSLKYLKLSESRVQNRFFHPVLSPPVFHR